VNVHVNVQELNQRCSRGAEVAWLIGGAEMQVQSSCRGKGRGAKYGSYCGSAEVIVQVHRCILGAEVVQ